MEIDDAFQCKIEQTGARILALTRAQKPSLFAGWQGQLMEWTMRDERFKTALFRFVDVLPSLHSPRETLEHLREYLGNLNGQLAPALKHFLKAGNTLPWLASPMVRHNVAAMANRFIAGRNGREAISVLRKRARRGIRFTVDILGEAAVSENEAEEYATRYLRLIEALAQKLPDPNVSIKISALYSQIHPAAPESAIEQLKNRLRPLLRRAQQLGVFINFDMENYALKALTLALFKSLVEEPEFSTYGRLGIVIQAYLRDSSERDLGEFIHWAAARPMQFTVRLVKGAYWDYERVVARQKNWPVPVFEEKAETDANYERLTRKLLENASVVTAAFGTHNVRSIAHAMVCAEALEVERSQFEFQMLFGMSEPMASALLEIGYTVREYAPVGELIPGMGYLVRRLLENTSNEGFLRAAFTAHAPPEELLRDPREQFREQAGLPSLSPSNARGASGLFQNEPLTDFTLVENRERMRAALVTARAEFGKTYPLLIGGERVETSERMLSLNPAAPDELIGHVSRASVRDAERAVETARRAFLTWRNTSVEERAAVLENAARLLRDQRFELAALEVFEAGKPWIEADGDIAEAIDFCNFYASEMRRIGTPQATDDVPGESNVQHYLPRGVGVIIAPWNFPVAILCGMTAAAIVTGNCVIMKPAEQTSVLAFRLAEIFSRAGVPPGALALLTGVGEEIGEFLIHDACVDFVAFTGSKEVGLKIYEATGRRFAKAVCEMGGKNAIIVDGDADLDEAVSGVVASAFGYAGQKCSACSRVIVLAESYERFLSRLVDATRSLAIGAPENPETIIGPLIDEAAWRRVREYIEIGKREAKLRSDDAIITDDTHTKSCHPERSAKRGVEGSLTFSEPQEIRDPSTPPLRGSAQDDSREDTPRGYFVPPIIFTDVPPTARITREEIFGPVLCVFKAATFDDALTLANDSEFALTAGLYSRSPAHIERAKRELVAGNVYINRPITGALVQRHPFGGFKMSGTGTKAGGRDYLKHFLLPRVVSENVMRRGFAPEE